MTRISDEYGAINLSQGFPDFDPPKEIMDALAKAAYAGPHQYSVTMEQTISGRHWHGSRRRPLGARLIRIRRSW